MAIDTGEFGEDKEVFYTERYKTLIRSQKELLIKKTQPLPMIEDAIKHAFRYDFYRLLRYYGVPAHMRWTVAFLNNVIDPNQDISKITTIELIDEDVIFEMLARSNTKKV